MLKRILLLVLLSIYFSPFLIKAQTCKLDYEPKGKIIKFVYDSITVYTDTNSIFNISFNYYFNKDIRYDKKVKNFVYHKVMESKSDTITFIGENIVFNPTIKDIYQASWYTGWAILDLTKENRVKVFDKHNKQVKVISIKKSGSEKSTKDIKSEYYNKENNELLFKHIIYAVKLSDF